MADETSTIDPALLVEHSGWVRSLAHHLVRDPSGAEDVAQETLLAALSRPPENAGDARRLRAWLGRVTHNLAHLAARGNARRRAREERVARAERLDSTADEVARDSAMRLVVDEVMGLREPYRTTIVLRYFEGHTTAEIAELTGTTESAVRKRLWRARGRLRRELDAVHDGDRLAWFGALAPLVRPDATPVAAAPSTASLGGLVGLGAGAAAAALVLGIVGGRTLLERTPDGPSPDVSVAATSLAAFEGSPSSGRVVLAPPRPAPGAASETARARRGGPRVRIEPVSPPSGPDRDGRDGRDGAIRVGGAVVDLWGHPLGGVRVVAQDAPEETLATSGANGTFTALVERLPVTLTVRAAGYGAVRTSRVEPGEAAWTQWLVAAPAVELSGRVLDPDGRPVAGARIEVTFDDAAFVELPILADLRTVQAPSTRTDDRGRFALSEVPTGPGIALRTAHASFLDDRRPVPGFSSWGMVIGLELRAVHVQRLAGVVEDERGAPVVGAEVSLDGRVTRTDERGGFALEGLSVRDGAPLVATKRGYRATVVAPPPGTWAEGSGRIRLVLGGAPSAISGRLVDAGGRPVEGWQIVAAAQPATDAGASPLSPNAQEDPVTPALDSLAFATSGADGAFVIEELAEGSYRVFAYQPDTLLATAATTVQAGGGELELVASPDAPLTPVHGRVTDRQGRAVAGARVGVVLAPDGAGAVLARASGPFVGTDREGWFRLPPVPQANVHIRVQHPGILAAAVATAPQESGGDLEIQVERLARFRAAGLDADRFALLDADGHELVVTGPTRSGRRGGVRDGRSAVHAARASARTLVWYREGEELGRAEITLSPDGLTELRP